MNEYIELSSPTNPDPLFMADFVGTEKVVVEKLGDAEVPGFEVEFTPDEAALAGAFREDALSASDAADSAGDDADAPEAAPAAP